MKRQPTVSVALATYNGAKHLQEQLESLADQTLLPHEVVLTDDRSTDATIDIAERFAATAPFPMRIVCNSVQLGFAENFFKAASLCTGDLIAFCDQDDKWLPHKLETCAESFLDPQVWVCVHTSRLWYGGERFGRCIPHFTEKFVLPAGAADPLCNYLGFSTVIRRCVLDTVDNQVRPRHPNVVKSVSGSPHPMVHDQWVWFIGSTFGKVAFIPEVQVFYRQHAGNTVGFTFTDRSVRQRLQLDKALVFAQGEEVALECAAYMEGLAAALPADRRARAFRAAQAMRSRAALNGLRKRIYTPGSSPVARVQAVGQLIRTAGYRAPSSTRFSFGPRALVKDVVVGLPAAQQVLRKWQGSSPI